MDSDEVARVVTDELAVGPLGWLVDSDEVARVVTDELAVGPLGWLVESDEGEKVEIGSLSVVPRDWLVDKSALGHNSAAGKRIPHAAQRAGLVTLGLVVP